MVLIAVLVALAIFCIILATYNFSQKESIDVAKRIEGYGKIRANRKRRSGDFWDDLEASRFKEWASNIAETLGNVLPKQQHFKDLAERADLPISGAELMVLLVASGILWLIFVAVFTLSIFKGIIVMLLWLGMWYFYIKNMGLNRMKDFDNQLGDAVLMMSNALRAGFTFQQAMETVSKELPDPMSGEFSRALQEINLGVSTEEALNGISRRMQSSDFDLLATAVIIQRQVGGNLSKIFDTIGNTIRDRVKLKREINVLTAEGVLAGWTVGLMPIALCLIMLFINPHYFDIFLSQSYAPVVIAGCVISELLGALIIRKIINVKI